LLFTSRAENLTLEFQTKTRYTRRVCEPECPAEAIKPDTEPGLEDWLKINTDYADKWPVLTAKIDPLPDAEEFDGKKDKYKQYFSEAPGKGDQ